MIAGSDWRFPLALMPRCQGEVSGSGSVSITSTFLEKEMTGLVKSVGKMALLTGSALCLSVSSSQSASMTDAGTGQRVSDLEREVSLLKNRMKKRGVVRRKPSGALGQQPRVADGVRAGEPFGALRVRQAQHGGASRRPGRFGVAPGLSGAGPCGRGPGRCRAGSWSGGRRTGAARRGTATSPTRVFARGASRCGGTTGTSASSGWVTARSRATRRT